MPPPDPLVEPFFEGAPLRLQRCRDCTTYQHPPVPDCRRCGGNVAWEPVSGSGRVATFTVNHHPWVEGQAPYVIGVVELDEQHDLRLTANLVQVDPDDVHIGMRVRAAFVEVGGRHVPVFRPDGGPA